MERPDFKYVIFKIVEVSLWNPPAKQHSQFSRFHPMWAESAVLPSWWIPWRYLYDFKNYIFEIRTFQGLKWRTLFVCIFSFNFLVFIIWGVWCLVSTHWRWVPCSCISALPKDCNRLSYYGADAWKLILGFSQRFGF